jgi:hypothetical protein
MISLAAIAQLRGRSKLAEDGRCHFENQRNGVGWLFIIRFCRNLGHSLKNYA